MLAYFPSSSSKQSRYYGLHWELGKLRPKKYNLSKVAQLSGRSEIRASGSKLYVLCPWSSFTLEKEFLRGYRVVSLIPSLNMSLPQLFPALYIPDFPTAAFRNHGLTSLVRISNASYGLWQSSTSCLVLSFLRYMFRLQVQSQRN